MAFTHSPGDPARRHRRARAADRRSRPVQTGSGARPGPVAARPRCAAPDQRDTDNLPSLFDPRTGCDFRCRKVGRLPFASQPRVRRRHASGKPAICGGCERAPCTTTEAWRRRENPVPAAAVWGEVVIPGSAMGLYVYGRPPILAPGPPLPNAYPIRAGPGHPRTPMTSTPHDAAVDRQFSSLAQPPTRPAPYTPRRRPAADGRHCRAASRSPAAGLVRAAAT